MDEPRPEDVEKAAGLLERIARSRGEVRVSAKRDLSDTGVAGVRAVEQWLEPIVRRNRLVPRRIELLVLFASLWILLDIPIWFLMLLRGHLPPWFRHYAPLWPGAVTMSSFFWYFYHSGANHRKIDAATGFLRNLGDKPAIPVLLDLLGVVTRMQYQLRPCRGSAGAAEALVRLLPTVTEDDAVLLPARRREQLHELAVRRRPGGAWGDLRMAALKALAVVGDRESLRVISRLAEAEGDWQVRQTAQICKTALESRLARGGEVLLRPSNVPVASPDELVRPAHGTDEDAPRQLLRATGANAETAPEQVLRAGVPDNDE